MALPLNRLLHRPASRVQQPTLPQQRALEEKKITRCTIHLKCMQSVMRANIGHLLKSSFSTPGQSAWDLWRTDSHSDRFLFEYVCCPRLSSFNQCSILSRVSPTLYYLSFATHLGQNTRKYADVQTCTKQELNP